MIRRLSLVSRTEWVLVSILVLAALLRIAGIGYGLPQMVVSDEPPFTLTALQMLESRTLIPALEPEAFRAVLLYPLYLSYVLLVPFSVILSFKYALFEGGAELFRATLLGDLSAFFLAARLVSVALGVFSVYLLYRIAESLFKSNAAALLSSFLLATSISHLSLSMVGRHWIPTMLIYLVVLFALTRSRWSFRRRYVLALTAAGIGMGFSTISILSLPLIGIYYLVFDAVSPARTLADSRVFLGGGALFAGLAAIPLLLYRGGNAFLGSVSVYEPKSLLELVASPAVALSMHAFSETVLIALFLIGLAALITRIPRAAALIALWSLAYIATLYALFRFEARFMLPLVPFYALAGGYALSLVWSRRTAVIVCVVLLVPLAASLRVAELAVRNDTRSLAREWVLASLGPEDRVLVYVAGMRVPTSPEAVEELRALDLGLVRQTDQADVIRGNEGAPHVLNNLSAIPADDTFFRDLPTYARRERYEYLVLGPEYAEGAARRALEEMTEEAELLERFEGFGRDMSVADSAFMRPLPELFARRNFGPTIEIYRLR